MLRGIKDLLDHHGKASECRIGTVKDPYFDDEAWGDPPVDTAFAPKKDGARHWAAVLPCPTGGTSKPPPIHCTMICFGFACGVSILGMCTVRMPSLLSQRTVSAFTLSGSEKPRSKLP